MKSPQAIFFDLDETLLDGSGFAQALARTCEAIAAERPDLDARRLLSVNGQVWSAYWPEIQDEWTLGVLDGAMVSGEAWRRTLSACGCDDEAIVRLAREAHSRHTRESYRPFDEAPRVIDELTDRLRIAVITNGAADTQREKLTLLGMDGCFQATVVSGELGIAKPDAAIFRYTLDKLGVAAGDVWHVGDSLTLDVAGAKGAGLTAVWLNRRGTERQPADPEPDVEIMSLTELLPLLDGTR